MDEPATTPPMLELPRFEMAPLDIPRLNLPALPSFAQAIQAVNERRELAERMQAQQDAVPHAVAPQMVAAATIAPLAVIHQAPPVAAQAPVEQPVIAVAQPVAATLNVSTDDVPSEIEADAGLPRLAVGLLLVCVGLLVYIANMSGSSALIACAALICTDLAIGARALPTTPNVARARTATLVGALGLTALASWKSVHQFSEMAFVAGLLVVLVVVVVLLLHAGASLSLRRRKDSTASQLLRSLSIGRLVALVATLGSGYLAFSSFSARPDAFATFLVLALVGMNLRHLHRKS